MKKLLLIILLLGIGGVGGCTAHKLLSEKDNQKVQITHNPKEIKDHLRYLESSLDSLHHLKPNPIPGEWLFHNRELRQYPHQFLEAHPSILDEDKQKIYIQPIGSFTPMQTDILTKTAAYLTVFYHVPVEILDSVSAAEVPSHARRKNNFGNEQLQTTYIMNKILQPNVPKDGRAVMGFTAYDLYPNDDYNFVFGQGRIGGEVGIYSIARFGYPDWDSTEYSMVMQRTFKVASHELGHIFGFRHCVDYECLMNGSNHMDETDRKPFYLCPLDLLKVTQGMGIDEIYRFQKLADFWRELGYSEQEEFYLECIRLLEASKNRKEGGIHNN